MAYLRELAAKCHDCHRRAVVELIDRWNGARGVYCRQCGKKALERQTRREVPNEWAKAEAGR